MATTDQDRIVAARLAQSVEHETLNLRVVGSSPTLGDILASIHSIEKFFKLHEVGVALKALSSKKKKCLVSSE